jgi:hypothetical protein
MGYFYELKINAMAIFRIIYGILVINVKMGAIN